MTTIRRNLKNTVNNYTDIQCKVREATCNEPWGPAASVMTEIADATYSVVEFAEIMSMIWKRLNDHGKNWRHVYKALVVLDYIIKTGSERVAQQCKEQIYSLLTLQDFRFIDKDGKDQGANVREKAKQLITLLKDEERLKSDRKKALQAKERFAQNSAGIGSQACKTPRTGTLGGLIGRSGESSRDYPPRAHTSNSVSSDTKISAAIEQARPSDRDEEEMQLELALAISKEEAQKDQEESDALTATLERSKTETRITGGPAPRDIPSPKPTLLALSQRPPSLDPWGLPLEAAPPAEPPANDPWAPSPLPPITSSRGTTQPSQLNDPWSSTPTNSVPIQPIIQPQPLLQPQPAMLSGLLPYDDLLGALDNFDPFGPVPSSSQTNSNDHNIMQLAPNRNTTTALPPSSKMATILDNRSKHLVNIDNLISTQTPKSGSTNPFGAPGSVFSGETTNPFLANVNNTNTNQPTLNQLRGPPTQSGGMTETNPFC